MPPGLRLSDISPKILVAVTQQWREAPEKQLGSKPQDSPLVAPTRGAGFSRKGPTNNSNTNNQNYNYYMTNHNTSQKRAEVTRSSASQREVKWPASGSLQPSGARNLYGASSCSILFGIVVALRLEYVRVVCVLPG